MPRGGKREGAGRPKAQHTIEAEAAKARLVELFIAEKEPVFKALIRKAKTGDIPAIKELFERVWGKTPAVFDATDDQLTLPFQIIIKPKDG